MENETKKTCAIFTLVKDESYFLKLWLDHYKRYFKNEDIYVLDHQSIDGGTDNLDVNVIKIYNELGFDYQFLSDTSHDQQKKLLEKYKCVIFTDVDELLYCLDRRLDVMIGEFVEDEDIDYLTCCAYEVTQDVKKEDFINASDDIFSARKNWFRTNIYDKTLVTKIPLKWDYGFHNIIHRNNIFKYNLYMAHLHRCDWNMMYNRHMFRVENWQLTHYGGYGGRHKLSTVKGIHDYYMDFYTPLTIIPEQHKYAIIGQN
jgi:hypothetical protein